MKCPHCETKLPLSLLKKSIRRPQPCPACDEGFTVTLSMSRMFLLIIPVAISLLMIRPISLYWGIPPSFFSALLIVLYVLSCATLIKRPIR